MRETNKPKKKTGKFVLLQPLVNRGQCSFFVNLVFSPSSTGMGVLRLSVCVCVCVCTDLPGRSQTPPPPSPFHPVSCFPPRRPPAAAAVETLPSTSWKHRKVFFFTLQLKKKLHEQNSSQQLGTISQSKQAALNPVFQSGSKEENVPRRSRPSRWAWLTLLKKVQIFSFSFLSSVSGAAVPSWTLLTFGSVYLPSFTPLRLLALPTCRRTSQHAVFHIHRYAFHLQHKELHDGALL